jgi:DNA invertase Pin-like site-specific DNA recombinase
MGRLGSTKDLDLASRARVAASYQEHCSLSAVAKEIGISRQAVGALLKRMGIDTSWRSKPLSLRGAAYRAKVTKISPQEKFWRQVNISSNKDECWKWVGKSKMPFGYGRMQFNGRGEYSHRLAWMFTYGAIPDDPAICVLHNCGIAACCNPNHLRLGTQKDNAADRSKHYQERGKSWGHWGRGRYIPSQKVEQVRALFLQGLPYRQIAGIVGIAPETSRKYCSNIIVANHNVL